jgi:hypothetical protein
LDCNGAGVYSVPIATSVLENGLRRVGHSNLFDTIVKSGAPACSINWRCAPHRVPDAAVVNRAAGPLC